MKKILDFLYPPRCQLCGGAYDLFYAGQLCAPCAADFRLNESACRVCGLPVGVPKISLPHQISICSACTKKPPVYDSCWSPFIYAQPLEWMIQQLKFNAKLNFAPVLSSLMSARLHQGLYKNNKPNAIIPMPLHNVRLKQRGFNQSHLLIKPVANALNLPIDINSCERVRNTEHQTGKNARQRQQNIKNAFTYKNEHNYQHVIVFDDVVTTGSSVSELTKTLKQSGVKRVDVWCLARAEKIN